MTDITDPRELGGSISGPGGPFDLGEVVIDASRAVIVDFQEIAKVDPKQGARGQMMFALLIKGRINQTADRVNVMLFESLDGLSALITEAHGVAERAGVQKELDALCDSRWERMPHPEKT